MVEWGKLERLTPRGHTPPVITRLVERGILVNIALAVPILVIAGTAIPPASSEEGDRITCFILGKIHPSLCPLTGYFDEDPSFIYNLEPIPSGLSDDERRKYDRLYYPRSRAELLKTYDMLFFSDARIQHFSPRQFHDLDYCFREAGLPSLWSFGPAYGQAIQSSILYEVLPVSDHDGHYHRSWRAVFSREREPVFLPFVELGVENVFGEGFAWVKPRQGSTVWADMQPLDTPFIVSWQPGGLNAGLTWVFADEFDLEWWGLASVARGRNPYAIDLATNLVFHSVGRPLISDIHARREARHLMSNFKAQKLLILAMMEWADNFGANVLPLSSRLAEIEEETDAALAAYLDQDYTETIRVMHLTELAVTEITGEAIALKDEALLWVYVLEWLVVTGCGLLSGAVVWSLMIRRSRYRVVGTTRVSGL